MRTRVRIAASLAVVCTIALLTATAAGLYSYTDAELTGPEQPIAFSHQVHATQLGIDCLYCHTGADKSQHATIPAVSTCMGCHQLVKQGSSEGSAEEIAKIHEHYCGQKSCPPGASTENGKSIPWIRIHNVPEHVQFKHNRHTAKGVECQECHGAVETMQRVYLVPDTKLRPRSLYLPAAKLEMGWCVDCHEKREASLDCAACHY